MLVIAQLRSVPYSCHVTALCGVHLQVRVSRLSPDEWVASLASARHVPDPQLVSPPFEDLEKDGQQVSKEQLQSLALSSEVRQALNAGEVQTIVATVDAAPCREAALAHALMNTEFANFCNTVLDVVSPSV